MERIGFGPRLVASLIDMILSFIVGSILAFNNVFSFIDLSNSTYFNSQYFKDIEKTCDSIAEYSKSDAKRYKDIAIKKPEVHFVKEGFFDYWLKSKKKLGGQNKIPRLSNDRKYLDDMLGQISRFQ